MTAHRYAAYFTDSGDSNDLYDQQYRYAPFNHQDLGDAARPLPKFHRGRVHGLTQMDEEMAVCYRQYQAASPWADAFTGTRNAWSQGVPRRGRRQRAQRCPFPPLY